MRKLIAVIDNFQTPLESRCFGGTVVQLFVDRIPKKDQETMAAQIQAEHLREFNEPDSCYMPRAFLSLLKLGQEMKSDFLPFDHFQVHANTILNEVFRNPEMDRLLVAISHRDGAHAWGIKKMQNGDRVFIETFPQIRLILCDNNFSEFKTYLGEFEANYQAGIKQVQLVYWTPLPIV